MLAIQFGYLPGLIWIVVGVCLAGAVQDMMVLAVSTQRRGQSLASLARSEIGRPAGIAASLSILYIIIIALAGLGVVVVKALGGEQVPMKAGTVLVYPQGAALEADQASGGPRVYKIPPKSTYKFGATADESMVFEEPFQLAVPNGDAARWQPRRRRLLAPREVGPARHREFVGDVHDRHDDPDRTVRRLVHVPASARGRWSRRR